MTCYGSHPLPFVLDSLVQHQIDVPVDAKARLISQSLAKPIRERVSVGSHLNRIAEKGAISQTMNATASSLDRSSLRDA